MDTLKDKSKFDEDSITTIFSSGKCVASVLMAILVDQGLIEYEKPVAEYWPEFAQNGKENITVEEVLRHEAGLARISTL